MIDLIVDERKEFQKRVFFHFILSDIKAQILFLFLCILFRKKRVSFLTFLHIFSSFCNKVKEQNKLDTKLQVG